MILLDALLYCLIGLYLDKLQQVLDSFIIFAAQQSDTKDLEFPSSASLSSGEPSFLSFPWMLCGPSNIQIVPFPSHEYTDDEFQSTIKTLMGVFYAYLKYLLGFLYPISRLISYSVFEKEQKIIEGLYMMGLQDGVFHLSWFHTSWVQHQKICSYQVNHIMLTVRISFIPSVCSQVPVILIRLPEPRGLSVETFMNNRPFLMVFQLLTAALPTPPDIGVKQLPVSLFLG